MGPLHAAAVAVVMLYKQDKHSFWPGPLKILIVKMNVVKIKLKNTNSETDK